MQKDLEYLYSSRKYFLAAAAVFIVSFLSGILISGIYPEASENVLRIMKATLGGITELDPFGMMMEIFKNNLRSSFAALLLGLGLGIVPIIFTAINGLILGILVEFFFKTKGILFVLAAILPHGIIELPMVLISVGIGLRLGHAAFLSLINQKTVQELVDELKKGIIFYARIVAPLLLLAAIVESYITPLIVSII